MSRPIRMQKQRTVTVTSVSTATAATALVVFALAGCGTESGAGPRAGAGPVRTDLAITGVSWSVDAVTVDGRPVRVPPGAGLEISEARPGLDPHRLQPHRRGGHR